MKKRLLSILLMCCMVLTLLPTAAFAEGSEEELPVCTCETACAVETMNAECSVCGAEGASAENCAKYIKPADDAAVQPEGEVSDPQPETALTALIGGNETAKEVSNESELTAAIADSTVGTVKLAGDISISSSLTVNRTVTLDLNGHVLKYESANKGSVIVVENGGQLTIEDSNTSNLSHKFNPNGKLWVLDDASGTEAVTGGVITGGTGTDISTFAGTTWYCGGGALIKNGGSLTMRGGNIIVCSAECGGGVCIDSEQGQFSMSGGSIAGCVASDIGGGVFASGTFKMSGQAVIRSCTAESATQYVCGGGIYVNVSSSFEMSDTAIIEGCQAISTSSNSSNGGGVYVSSSSSFVMSNEAKIEGCQAISNSSKASKGGGVHLANNTKFTLSGSAVIQNCTATNSANSGEAYGGGVSAACVKAITLADSARIVGCAAANGSGLYITGSQVPGYGILYANSGSVDGDVVLGDTEDGPCTITGSGGTVFNGKVTVTPGSTIEKGTFNGEVINNGTITGGVFNSTVSGSGTITGGTFNTPMTGSGTESDPYQIGTAEQLKLFRDKVNNAKTKEETKICAVLTANIDLKNEEWTPIGIGNGTENNGATIDFPYSGTFDGNGHTISGLNVNYRNKNGGLFCYVMNATIKNLTVAGSVTHSSEDGVAYGGIVGCADSSTIENCTNRCTVTGNWYAGGIVGWSTDSDIIGCANFGNISSPSFSGGICGKIGGENDAAGIDATIRDCYNVGMVSGGYAGGITGQSDSEDIDILIANCYNVGSLHGSTNTGEIIGDLSGPICTTIDNCYYLPTGNPASTSDRVNVKRTDSKTAAEFADGTVVLALLINSRADSEHPWNSQCQYMAAAGKTLPVFKTQTGDKHTHGWSVWTSNDDGTHSRRCTCNAVETQNCSGGTATCTAKAKCADCGAEYGDTNPKHHGDKLKHVVAKDATTSEEGNIEYWYCEACGKYFSDNAATKEITQAETVIPKRQSSGSNYSYYTIKATAGTGGAISPSGNVSVREGRDQTFTITPDKGYAVANVKIDGKSIGAVKSYTFENVRRTHTIEVIFMKANGNPQTGVFVDVATGSYYEDAVDWAVENGITKGTDDTHFSPDGICTRAQAVTFLWRTAGSPASKTSTMPFTDVPVGSYYYDAVLWAVENGITKGTSDTTFSPNMTCTRAQIVAFLWRSEKSPAAGTANPFADVKSTAYYAGAVLWAVREDITKGTTNTTFSPDADCTRAQIVTFLWRCKK